MKALLLILLFGNASAYGALEAFCFYTSEAGFASGRILSSKASLEAMKLKEKTDHAYDHLRNCMHIEASKTVLKKVRKTYEDLMKESSIPGKEVTSTGPVIVHLRGAEAHPNRELLTLPKKKNVKLQDEKNNEIALTVRLVHKGIMEFVFQLNGKRPVQLYRGLGSKETISLDLLLREWGVQDTMFARIEKIDGKRVSSQLRFISTQKN